MRSKLNRQTLQFFTCVSSACSVLSEPAAASVLSGCSRSGAVGGAERHASGAKRSCRSRKKHSRDKIHAQLASRPSTQKHSYAGTSLHSRIPPCFIRLQRLLPARSNQLRAHALVSIPIQRLLKQLLPIKSRRMRALPPKLLRV
jgi:hypothetical protein